MLANINIVKYESKFVVVTSVNGFDSQEEVTNYISSQVKVNEVAKDLEKQGYEVVKDYDLITVK